MVHFNWTIDQIRDRYSYLCRLYSKNEIKSEEGREKLIEDLALLKSMLEDKDLECQDASLLERYHGKTEQLEDIDYLWGEIRDFSICTKEDFATVPIKTCSLSRKDLLDLTHDFYKHCFDHFFFGNFMKSFYRRRDHILFEPANIAGLKGESFSIHTTKESFLTVKREFTYDDLITTAHEYMHATSFAISGEHFLYSKEPYSEIDTTLVELLACDYFESVFKDHKMDALKVALHKKFCDDAHNMSRLMSLYELESELGCFTCNRDLRRKATECGITDLDNVLDDTPIIPTLDYMFAIEFYYLYKVDKDKALNTLKKFIMMDYDDDVRYCKELNNLGLFPNANSRELHKERVMLSRILKKRQ